jgi:L-threonylcarbamoyladenylate synthase
VEEGAGAESPGQHPKHYSPRTPVFLNEEPGNGRGFRLNLVDMPGNAAGYAQKLYGVLHELDRQGYDWISIEMPPEGPEWAGVADRLRRAANRGGSL